MIPERVRNRTPVALAVGDFIRDYRPRRPGAYLRTSCDRRGDERAIDLQLHDSEEKRIKLGWGPFAETYRENDTGAFKKRRIAKTDGSAEWAVMRPEFHRMLGDLLSGRIDGIIFYDTDRLARQPRDLEDLIDVVEHTKHPAIGVTGDLNLINDADRHMARMLCIMALKASEDTSRRVARNHLADATAGELTGRTPYAWNPDGTLRPDRARVACRIYERFTSGMPIAGIARELNRDKIPSPRGAKWAPATVKVILTSPRYCGFASYRGKHRTQDTRQTDGWGRVLLSDEGLPINGKWEPVISRKAWADAQLELDRRRLQDRRMGVSGNLEGANQRKHVFTGLLRCGICRARMSTKWVSRRGHVIYYCPGKVRNACGKVSRRAAPVDAWLEELITEWARARAAAPSATGLPTLPVSDVRAHISMIDTRKGALISAWAADDASLRGMRPDDYYQALSSMNAELDRLAEQLAWAQEQANRSLARDYENEWKQGGLEQRRAITGKVFKAVYIMPSGKGRAPFNPAHVSVEYVD
ncbi:recombinase family protein [Streptomyces sp. RKAG290]|uniref:recombinase family protein n=1 Tax=Streptomyces sp. RKAG290 TaxID=2888348 RepID=UPI0020332209|nr:recombinase family protein [Streptomyces sp. RKAG290]MCM2413535.1 recombinase family protein [Streptomyces sp. RKAG290]